MPFSNTSMSKASCIITKFMILFDVMIIWSYYASNKNKRTKGINLTRENIKQQNKVVRCCGHATYFNWSLSCVDSKKKSAFGLKSTNNQHHHARHVRSNPPHSSWSRPVRRPSGASPVFLVPQIQKNTIRDWGSNAL